jgi:ABC-type glycerol-3-phosphate transport system substrate-binding protein
MQRKKLSAIVAALIVAVSVVAGCGGGATAGESASAAAAAAGAPSGAYQSGLPDGTTIRLTFRDAGEAVIAMTEAGQTTSQNGKWILNGEVILLEGTEGLTLQLSWRGDALVTDFGGLTLTFTKV